MTFRDAIEAEAHRLTYWQACRGWCARIRDNDRRGFAPEMNASNYRLLTHAFLEWRRARDWQRGQHEHRRAA